MSAPNGITFLVDRANLVFRAQQRAAERARMASYIARVGDAPGRCADCAFREGTPASESRMVFAMVEHCLPDPGNNFCCHHGEPDRPCVGFTALRDSLRSEPPTPHEKAKHE